ncbi:MAG: hypothetical protein RR598_10525 [Anaerorhabdus sp.]|uniref:hypothetical protein n=1 Tax=Anaerorhabdus sp. TaxID=1872524 RepID=UPI002FCCA518
MPSRLERLNRLYWTKRDIQLVLNISNEKSNYVFNEVKKIELAKSKFEAHSTKVAMKNVLKFTDNDERLLRRQIESENAQKKSSTTANQVNSN